MGPGFPVAHPFLLRGQPTEWSSYGARAASGRSSERDGGGPGSTRIIHINDEGSTSATYCDFRSGHHDCHGSADEVPDARPGPVTLPVRCAMGCEEEVSLWQN